MTLVPSIALSSSGRSLEGQEHGTDEEIEGARGKWGACCGWWGWKGGGAKIELGIYEHGK
jgi:hypothetical protein